MRKKVIVIGHGYTSRLSIIRSLAELDCEITVIAMVFQNWWGRLIRFNWGKPIDCHSKYVKHMFYCHAKDKDGLVSLLLEKCADSEQKAIIIPDSDFSAMVIDNNQERLKEHFLFPHINHIPGAVEQWMNKEKQKKLAAEVGMNVAKGQIITIKNHSYTIPSDLIYPCFTKPLATVGGGKQFLKQCNCEADLRKVLDAVSLKMNGNILVEDFKTITNEYAVVGFSDGKDVVIPGIIEFIANSKSHFGIAREGLIKPITGYEEILRCFREFVVRIGFCGLFDIDFYESDGKLYFGEMNLRFGGSGYAVTKRKVNLPVMLVRFLSGESYADMNQLIKDTSSYVNERMLIDDWCYNYLSESECRRIIQNADIKFVYDDKDPGPQKALEQQIKLFRVKRKLKKWLGK